MRSTRTVQISPPPSQSGPRRRRTVVTLVVLVVVVAGAFAGRWCWRRAALARTVQRGLTLLADANSAPEVAAALDEWEQQTSKRWRGRREDLIAHLFSEHSLEDRRIRALLTRVAGADYANRREDWQRWFETRRRLRQGKQPKVKSGQRVRLEPRWKAPIGLTAWFTTIIPLDGQIYVASLGTSFGSEHDAADGIVRVDGSSGIAQLIFHPPDGRLRDLLGIAAGNDCLFATCRNGFVYCVEPDGTLRWRTRAGRQLAAAPLAIDVNRDDVTDVVVATSAGKVVAVSGRTGRTVWVASPVRGSAGGRGSKAVPGTALAAGPVIDDSCQDVIVTTPAGDVRVLAARNGRLRWSGTLTAGVLGGPLVCAGQADGGPPAFVADQHARVWSLVRSGGAVSAVPAWDLTSRSGEGFVAALRTLAGTARTPLLIACPTSSYAGHHASVCALEPGGLRWRYSPDGAIWATPALADLTGDGKTELVVVSIDTDQAGRGAAAITILSEDGHCLRRLRLPDPVECSPVVADVDGDQRLELLIADQAGWLHCYATNRSGPVEWGLFGGDSHNTRSAENAFRCGQVPVGVQWRWNPE